MRRCQAWLVMAGIALLAGCAATGASANRSASTTLSAAEIRAANLPTLYDVIDRLRPRWLVARGGSRHLQGSSTIYVYQGQVNLGNVSALRHIGPETIESAEFIDAATASATLPGLGGRQVEGAILLRMKVGT